MNPGFEGLLQPGDRAPDFTLAAVQTDGIVSLSDYRNGRGLFLGLFRGLYCPFCRRAIAQMAFDLFAKMMKIDARFEDTVSRQSHEVRPDQRDV